MIDDEGENLFGETIAKVGPAILAGLDALEQAFRQLHPPAFPVLQVGLAPVAAALEAAERALGAAPTPVSLTAFRQDLCEILRLTRRALSAFVETGPPEAGITRVFAAMHDFARAEACLYPLHPALPAVSEHFLEPFRRGRAAHSGRSEARPARGGLFRSGAVDGRGGFDLYVPEHYDGSQAWPLVVALHGGSGNGADFLWSWLREARSRDFILLAPTSLGRTWSLHAPAIDGERLARQIERIVVEWRVDQERVLLTGLSDGATMTFLVGGAADSPFTHLAPIAGVLHPMNLANGNLERLRGRPVYLVHGALDWMFPVALAREAARILERSGADLVYRELEDLSHTYPREQNAKIIEWFDPRRAQSALAAAKHSSVPR